MILGVFIVFGCSSPRYLPQSGEIDVNQYGSFINISRIHGGGVHGELLAVDTTTLIVLTDSGNQEVVKKVPVADVNSFSLRYARARNYWWTVPVFLAVTVSHGAFLVITAPVNLAVTLGVAAGGQNAYKYSSDEISYLQLKMFARFPAGIPPNLSHPGEIEKIR